MLKSQGITSLNTLKVHKTVENRQKCDYLNNLKCHHRKQRKNCCNCYQHQYESKTRSFFHDIEFKLNIYKSTYLF